jgi:hypothetical protein
LITLAAGRVLELFLSLRAETFCTVLIPVCAEVVDGHLLPGFVITWRFRFRFLDFVLVGLGLSVLV